MNNQDISVSINHTIENDIPDIIHLCDIDESFRSDGLGFKCNIDVLSRLKKVNFISSSFTMRCSFTKKSQNNTKTSINKSHIVVGFCTSSNSQALANIDIILIHPRYRKLKLGLLLWAFVIKHAQEQGEIHSIVFALPEAINFFQSLGYSTRKPKYKIGDIILSSEDDEYSLYGNCISRHGKRLSSKYCCKMKKIIDCSNKDSKDEISIILRDKRLVKECLIFNQTKNYQTYCLNGVSCQDINCKKQHTPPYEQNSLKYNTELSPEECYYKSCHDINCKKQHTPPYKQNSLKYNTELSPEECYYNNIYDTEELSKALDMMLISRKEFIEKQSKSHNSDSVITHKIDQNKVFIPNQNIMNINNHKHSRIKKKTRSRHAPLPPPSPPPPPSP